MVNVGGRSKGCTNCRKRRVKCDEHRPTCNRCERARLRCDGPRDTVFITGTIVDSRRSQRTRDKQVTRSPHLAVQPVLHAQIHLRPDEREVSICYTRKALLPNGPIDLALQNLKIADLALACTKRYEQPTDQPFDPAALSFAMVYFGTKYRQPAITTEGYILHGQALARLNHTLSNPQSCHHDDVILSVVTLAMLECLVPTGPRNYLKHMLGLGRLLELRSPASLVGCSPVSSMLYKGVRHMVLFASLRAGRASVLARPEWKAALRAHCSVEEEQEQDLYDVLADCTVLLARRDGSGGSVDVVGLGDDLHCKAMTLLAAMRRWKARWDRDAKNACVEEDDGVPQTGEKPQVHGQISGFPTILRFTSDSSAKALMLYNTTLIYVLRTLSLTLVDRYTAHCYSLPAYLGEQQQHKLWKCITEGDFSSAERLAALEVARCIPDHLSRKRANAEGQFILPVVQWAVTTAGAVLGGKESVEGRWMMDLLNENSGQVIADGVWESSLTPAKTAPSNANLGKAQGKVCIH